MLTKEIMLKEFAGSARKGFSYLDGSWKRVKEPFVVENVSLSLMVRLQ